MPELPYSRTETFVHKGKSYPDEPAVIRAAVSEILVNNGMANQILEHACDLAPLLARFCELQGVTQRAPRQG